MNFVYTVLSAHSQLNTPEKLAVLKVPSHQRHCIKSICVKQRNQRFLPRYCKLFSMFIKTAKTAITTGLKRIATVLLRCHRHEKCSDCNKVTAPSLIISSEHAEKKIWFAHPGFQFAHPARLPRNGCPPCPPYRGGFKGKGLVGH